MKLWDNNMNNFFNFNVRVHHMSVENEDMTTRKQVIEPQTGMSTPRKVSLSESGHECQVISGSRSVLGLGTYHQYLYMIEYGRKDQWNFSHYWQCPISKIIAKAFKYTMEGILEKNWTNLYPEAEEVIPYTPTGISVESVPERSHNRGIGMGGTKYTPRSEEHTSELQSPCNLVCRLLLEKKKKIK